MDAPDPKAITQVEVEAPQAKSVTDLNGLNLPLNDATRDAWNALRDAFLSREDDLQSASRPIARQAILNRASGTGPSPPNKILGAGIGMCEPTAEDVNGTPQSACIVLYVAESMTTQEAIDYLADTYDISELAVTEAYVRVFQTGPIEALSRKSRMRPASGGVSIAHQSVTAGTFGCLCKGRTFPRNQRVLVLSNNHVLANFNRGSPRDYVLQPGPSDGGKLGHDTIGMLEKYVKIDVRERVNLVDCATAWVHPSDVRSDLRSGINPKQFLSIFHPTVQVYPGMPVAKSGRTTGLTMGTVDSIMFMSSSVQMFKNQHAQFVDQIAIRDLPGQKPFSRDGDSGSLVWADDSRRNPVGLLFAGGSDKRGNITLANSIDNVLNALDIDLIY